MRTEHLAEDRRSRAAYSRQHVRRMQQWVGLSASVRVLELGAADGQVSTELADLGVTVHAVDLDGEALGRFAGRPGLGRVRADAGVIPFRSSSFEAVAAFDVLEHLPAPVTALRDIHRSLIPGGWFFMSTPNLNGLERRLRPTSWSGAADPTHLYLWSEPGLRHTLAAAGFDVLQVTTPVYGLPARLAFLLSLPKLGSQLWVVSRKLG